MAPKGANGIFQKSFPDGLKLLAGHLLKKRNHFQFLLHPGKGDPGPPGHLPIRSEDHFFIKDERDVRNAGTVKSCYKPILVFFSVGVQEGGVTHEIDELSEFGLVHAALHGKADQVFPFQIIDKFWDVEFSHSPHHHPAQSLGFGENAFDEHFFLLLILPCKKSEFILALEEAFELLIESFFRLDRFRMIWRIVSRSQEGLDDVKDKIGEFRLKFLEALDLFRREALWNSLQTFLRRSWRCRFRDRHRSLGG